ncbi:MAG: alpha/beta hydrolase [Candidatus Puniceispirillales bacterium]
MSTIIRQSIADHSVLIHQNNGASSPQQLIVLLHGWGADGSDLIDLAPHLSARFPHAVICAPDGPEPCTANPMGRQWFDLGVDATQIDEGPSRAFPGLQKLLQALMEQFHISASQLAVAGFSQGGMMALYSGVRLTEAPGAIISIAGALLAPNQMAQALTAKPPVLLVHGKDDQVVPFQAMDMAKMVLESNGISVETLACEGVGHGISDDGLNRLITFIEDHLEISSE